jgi:hypothetical protein
MGRSVEKFFNYFRWINWRIHLIANILLST